MILDWNISLTSLFITNRSGHLAQVCCNLYQIASWMPDFNVSLKFTFNALLCYPSREKHETGQRYQDVIGGTDKRPKVFTSFHLSPVFLCFPFSPPHYHPPVIWALSWLFFLFSVFSTLYPTCGALCFPPSVTPSLVLYLSVSHLCPPFPCLSFTLHLILFLFLCPLTL